MDTSKIVGFFKRNRWRLLLAAAIAVIVAVFYLLGFDRYLSLAGLRHEEASLMQMYAQRPALWIFVYFAVYVAVTGLSLPLAIPITLLGGAVFGVLWGSVIVTFAAALGATLSFWAARFLFRDWVQARFARQLDAINRGIERDGIFYLFLLRLIPAFPFFVINLVMGVTPMRTRTYFLVSLIAMIPGNVLYVNAGAQLAQVKSPGDLLSPTLIASFVALGVFPLIVKKGVDYWRRRRQAGEESPSGSPFPEDGQEGEPDGAASRARNNPKE